MLSLYSCVCIFVVSMQDFGDGGAFPEIPVAQYPIAMGMKKATSNALTKQLDASGKIKYDAIARFGHGKDKVSLFLTVTIIVFKNICITITNNNTIIIINHF